jgi:hypothetical protein
MNIATAVEIEADPIEIDPRPCSRCGLTVTNYARTTGSATNWTASEVIRAKCLAY